MISAHAARFFVCAIVTQSFVSSTPLTTKATTTGENENIARFVACDPLSQTTGWIKPKFVRNSYISAYLKFTAPYDVAKVKSAVVVYAKYGKRWHRMYEKERIDSCKTVIKYFNEKPQCPFRKGEIYELYYKSNGDINAQGLVEGDFMLRLEARDADHPDRPMIFCANTTLTVQQEAEDESEDDTLRFKPESY